ncbi:IS110 family RNA-guided transposase [Xanthobacter dioxanivorans]|uniref:IS110 family transposase n=1 Tax=Xanthobacter dioxanivorans TaxID=2528964 RepID=UPI001E3FB929|nr:IS110 family transposase [Xanthobacter dioxanivorans]
MPTGSPSRSGASRLRSNGDDDPSPRSPNARRHCAYGRPYAQSLTAPVSSKGGLDRRRTAFRTHQCFVRQRTQLINALRGHLAEFGLIVAQGPAHLKQIIELLDEAGPEVPDAVREIVRLYLDQIDVLTRKIEELHRRLRDATQENAEMRRLCTVPGVGPVTAGAVLAFAPDLRAFSSGRNFAAWLGLVPKQRSTGGKTRLGGVSKMGQTDIRKLLIIGAMSRIRWIIRKGVLPDSWLGQLVGRKPRMVAAVALANKMARIIWAIMTREENYRMA